MSTFWQQHNTLYNNWLRSWWCQHSDNNTIHCTTGWEVGDVNVLTTQYTVQQLVEKLVMSTFWQHHNTLYNWLISWWCQRSDNNTIHSTTTGREVGDVNVLTTTQYTVKQHHTQVRHRIDTNWHERESSKWKAIVNLFKGCFGHFYFENLLNRN